MQVCGTGNQSAFALNRRRLSHTDSVWVNQRNAIKIEHGIASKQREEYLQMLKRFHFTCDR